jgi:hypothetical protein
MLCIFGLDCSRLVLGGRLYVVVIMGIFDLGNALLGDGSVAVA